MTPEVQLTHRILRLLARSDCPNFVKEVSTIVCEEFAAYRATQEEDAGKMTAEQFDDKVFCKPGKICDRYEFAEAYHQYRASVGEPKIKEEELTTKDYLGGYATVEGMEEE